MLSLGLTNWGKYKVGKPILEIADIGRVMALINLELWEAGNSK